SARAPDDAFGGWDIRKVTTLSAMFRNSSLTRPNVAAWDLVSVRNLSHMFDNARTATPDVRTWNLHKVTTVA
ncbi:unnamed protein product, partial [Amoebophrya sp. A120]